MMMGSLFEVVYIHSTKPSLGYGRAKSLDTIWRCHSRCICHYSYHLSDMLASSSAWTSDIRAGNLVYCGRRSRRTVLYDCTTRARRLTAVKYQSPSHPYGNEYHSGSGFWAQFSKTCQLESQLWVSDSQHIKILAITSHE
jgi:hypothetical protein